MAGHESVQQPKAAEGNGQLGIQKAQLQKQYENDTDVHHESALEILVTNQGCQFTD